MIFVDSHCHIDGPEFDADRDEVVQRAIDAGVKYMLNVATGDPTANGQADALSVQEAMARGPVPVSGETPAARQV